MGDPHNQRTKLPGHVSSRRGQIVGSQIAPNPDTGPTRNCSCHCSPCGGPSAPCSCPDQHHPHFHCRRHRCRNRPEYNPRLDQNESLQGQSTEKAAAFQLQGRGRAQLLLEPRGQRDSVHFVERLERRDFEFWQWRDCRSPSRSAHISPR